LHAAGVGLPQRAAAQEQVLRRDWNIICEILSNLIICEQFDIFI
jgi:hypothetical protein